MSRAILFDIGSTYTKARLVDLEEGKLLSSAQALTTVDEDVSLGVCRALEQVDEWKTAKVRLACSSAAGGLRMIAIGLVPSLTAEAARRAALGAGARVLTTYSYDLSPEEVEEIEELKPDIILLAGGTDGGNKEHLLANSRLLADSSLICPVVLAGNRKARGTAHKILEKGGFSVFPTENVMPELEVLNIEPCRELIRKIFLQQITKAKGLENLPAIDNILMPTPAAVLEGAQLLYKGPEGKGKGWGDLLLVDIGGATTDIHSLAPGEPKDSGVTQKGLPEPLAKRTVEGDLGLRYNARSIYSAWGEEKFQVLLEEMFSRVIEKAKIEKYLQEVEGNPGRISEDGEEKKIELALARAAAALSSDRHSGYIEQVYTPHGRVYFQYGKDLTGVKQVIGCGGLLGRISDPRIIMEGAVEGTGKDNILRPEEAELFIDNDYVLFAAGLLADIYPEAAFKLMERSLKKLERGKS